MTRVAIAAGGTAGHVVPALAVADALRAEGAHVEFLGGERAEAELVPSAGYPFHPLRVAGLDRRNPLKAARALLWAGRATGRARRILRAMDADIVLGGGGYVAGAGRAGRAQPGPAARPDRGRQPPGRRQPAARAVREARLPGVRPAEAHGGQVDGHGPADPRGHRRSRRGRGARPLRDRRRPRVPARVRRVAGRAAPERGRDRGIRRSGAVLGAARVRAARLPRARAAPGGAGPTRRTTSCTRSSRRSRTPTRRRTWRWRAPADRCSSSLAAGLPAVLVPYPHATADHQTKNARWTERGGAAVVVPDDELDGPRLAREVAALLGAPDRLRAMQRAARELARPDAAERIAHQILMLVCK